MMVTKTYRLDFCLKEKRVKDFFPLNGFDNLLLTFLNRQITILFNCYVLYL